MDDSVEHDFTEFVKGKTFIGCTGPYPFSFRFSDGSCIFQRHDRDCCESVEPTDYDDLPMIEGDYGEVILFEERTNPRVGEPTPPPRSYSSYIWEETFYTMRTTKGDYDWRWQGSSNGYYSIAVQTYYVPSPN